MLTGKQKQAELTFDQIDKGKKGGFDFKITNMSQKTLFGILSKANTKTSISFLAKKWDVSNLLASLLHSTFAGMFMPGKFASIMNVDIAFDENIKLGKRYSLKGEASSKSSMGTISEKIVIERKGAKRSPKVSEGKMNVKINKPFVAIPSVEELKNNAKDLQLKDKVVLITGASRGIGATTAKLFSIYGAKVVVTYLNGRKDAEGIVREIVDAGGAALARQADISNPAQVSQMVRTICNQFSSVDILVNNAVRNFIAMDFMELSWDEVQRDIDVTVRGAFHCCQAIAAVMMKNGGGKIINISTNAAENPPAGQFKYVVAKNALIGLTRSLAVEFASRNIQVNMVVPSMVETDLTSGVSEMVLKGVIQSTPMKRLATPEDVAKAILYLASSMSDFTTGQKVMVTGGNAPFL